MQSLNIGFSLAKNSSLDSCASSEALPYRVLEITAHDTRYLRRFVERRRFCASLPLLPSRISVSLPACLGTRPGAPFLGSFACRRHSSAPRTPKPVNSPPRFPSAGWEHIAHVLWQISAVSVTRGSGDGGGRAGTEGPLALRRLGAAWHWARLFPACPAVTVIGLPTAPIAVGGGPDTKALVIGPSQDDNQAGLLCLLGGVGPFLFFLGLFFFLMPPQYPPATNPRAGGHSEILLKIRFA